MFMRKMLSLAFCTALLFAGGCAQEEPGDQVREEVEEAGAAMEEAAEETAEEVGEVVDAVKEEMEEEN